MQIKCIITDDEPIARKGLRGYVEKIDFLQPVGECKNALELNNLLKEQEADLLFLDIEMPHLSGVEFLKSIQNPPKVILTTAYERYALEGYELDVVDYLLKPIPFERFIKAANKVHDVFAKEQQMREGKENHVFIRSDKQYKKIELDDILFVEGMENYILVHTLHAKETVHMTLKHFKESLPENRFIQVHRSYLVNIKHVKSIDGNQLVLGYQKIPVARSFREEVFNLILHDRLISK